MCRSEPGAARDQREPEPECGTDGMPHRLRGLLPFRQGDSTICEQHFFLSSFTMLTRVLWLVTTAIG
jgi:hypothetical protein